MSQDKTIDQVIGKMADSEIVLRRKNLGISILILAAAALIAYVDYAILSIRISWLGCLLAFSFILAAVLRFMDNGTPYYKPTGEKLRQYKLQFDSEYLLTILIAAAAILGNAANYTIGQFFDKKFFQESEFEDIPAKSYTEKTHLLRKTWR